MENGKKMDVFLWKMSGKWMEIEWFLVGFGGFFVIFDLSFLR